MFLGFPSGQAERERSLLQQKAATTLVSSEEPSCRVFLTEPNTSETARFVLIHMRNRVKRLNMCFQTMTLKRYSAIRF